MIIKKHYEYSSLLRITHWLRAVAIIGLTFTGFYLAYPYITSATNTGEPTNFLNALMRSWHIIFGFLLVCVTVGRTYLFFFDRQSKGERISFWDFIIPKIWIQQVKYYLFIGDNTKLRGVYNPLQFITYTLIQALLIIMCITGFILYIHVYHEGFSGLLYDILRPIEVMMGGLAMVRDIHHICMWIFIIFFPIHIYLVVFNAIYGAKGDLMDSIISGYKWKHEKK